MSEPVEQATETVGQAGGFEPITSQEALDKIVSARLSRERAKYADYDALKALAARAEQVEADGAGAVQKLEARTVELERELEARTVELERARVIAAHGIPADYQDLVVGEGDALEASAVKVAELVQRSQRAPFVPAEGVAPAAPVRAADPLR